VEPVPTGQPGPDGTQAVDLRVIQDAGPPRTLAGQAGYATGQGFTLRGSWTHRNLFPPEGALIVSGVAGTQEQGASVAFRRSNAGRRDRTVSLSLNASHQDFEAYEAFTASIIGRIARESTPIWQKRWTWNYGFELITTDERRKVPGRATGDGTYFIGALPAQIGYDRSNNLLDPTRGFRLTARVSPEISQRAKGGMEQYGRGLIDGSIYYPAGDSLVLAGRVRLGSIVGAPRDEIAPSRRLYAGGGGSVRGFGFQELGPRDIENNPIGGRSLNEFAVEARYRFGNYGVVGFVDAGQVYESSMPKFSDIRFGAGIGGRLYTNFGPLRVDVATPIGRRKGESLISVYVSIGQAF
jgi:translocation and assembly module TamA